MSAAPANPITPAIEMRGVAVNSMKDPGITVAEKVDWSVAPGEFWVVAGPQRSGKSDFLMLTGGLMAPADGVYRLFGEDMPIFQDARLRERLRLGYVFDGGQLFNHMTIAENVAVPLRYHQNLTGAEAEPRVQAMLELTELTPWANSTPGNVARNWQKRAGLARALALRPDVLLLDNPLGGLDARHTNWWLNFLDQLSCGHGSLGGDPMTVVVTADDLRPWKSGSRRFALLKDKRFAALGAWPDLERATDPAVRELLAHEPAGD
jgi:ABC-type transporter Mla maintaining outer membrane lipid asymmetry ATPase subunit MlaF